VAKTCFKTVGFKTFSYQKCKGFAGKTFAFFDRFIRTLISVAFSWDR
jgi:hypothetical protein